MGEITIEINNVTVCGVIEVLSKVIHFYVLLADSEHLISPWEWEVSRTLKFSQKKSNNRG